MTTTIDFKNADYGFIEPIKEMARQANVEFQQRDKVSRLDRAIKEIENGEVERFKTFEEFEKSLDA